MLAVKMHKYLMHLDRQGRISCKHVFNANRIGRPYLVELDGLSLDVGLLYYLSHVYEIIKYTNLQVKGNYIFADLGAGFGGIISFLLRLFPNSKAIVFDLPETLIFSTYYLCKNFKSKKIGLFSDFQNIEEGIDKFDIILLPSWMIEKMPLAKVDCFINTGSLPEMGKETALHFINVIRKVIKPGGYFYSYNIWSSLKTDLKVRHGVEELFASASLGRDFDFVCDEYIKPLNDILDIKKMKKTILKRKEI